jgi:glutathione peroxidase
MNFDMIQKLAVGAALAITGTACTQDAPRTPEDLARWSDASLWSLEITDIDGTRKPLAGYEGKVALVVNVASRCGYTPQYKQLQQLHESMKGRDFVLLGIPSNDFGGQEPGTSEQIKDFCTTRYGVDFPMFQKQQVKAGEKQSDLYALLGTQSGKLPGWNFCKYVVGRDGKVVAFFPSGESPTGAKIRAAIDKALAAPAPESTDGENQGTDKDAPGVSS